MATKQEREAVAAVKAWCEKQKTLGLPDKVRHVHTRSYVIGYAAPKALVVANCWAESEPQCQEWDKKYPLNVLHDFDESLKPGDWCISAYCVFGERGAWNVAVAIPG